MIDHLGIPVKNYSESKAFYLSALAPLGIGVVMEVTDAEDGPALGLGANGKPFFWMSQARVGGAMHLAGVRAHYHPNYYGAFVIDLNGVNLEAVCHAPN